ncbi:hypothetical protein PIB30_093651, partial [Stylosanthes scabra]|nr:hypothetical protein [Stylosanthes scabra]
MGSLTKQDKLPKDQRASCLDQTWSKRGPNVMHSSKSITQALMHVHLSWNVKENKLEVENRRRFEEERKKQRKKKASNRRSLEQNKTEEAWNQRNQAHQAPMEPHESRLDQ